MKRTYGKNRYSRSVVNGVRFWLVLVVLVSSFGPMLVSADVVWSDDFDDGNYDGWTVHSGAFSCNNYYLESTEVERHTLSGIYHESNVSKGTWSFDCYLPSGSLYVKTLTDEDGYGHLTVEITPYRIALWLYPDKSFGMAGDWDSTFSDIWTHIDVTVKGDTIFDVFVNGDHRISYTNASTLSRDNWCFIFWSTTEGQAIDNVVVRDTILESLQFNETPTTTTTTSPPPTEEGFDMTMILLVGGGVAVVVIVLVVCKVRGRT